MAIIESQAELPNGSEVQWLSGGRHTHASADISFLFQTTEESSQPEAASESIGHMNGAACRQENGIYSKKRSVPSKRIRTWRGKVSSFSLNLCPSCFWDEECNSLSPRICLKPSHAFHKLAEFLLASVGLKYFFRYMRTVPCGLKSRCDRMDKWHKNTLVLMAGMT